MKNTKEITMDCKACRAALPDVLFGEAGQRSDVRAHLRACADCRQELEELQATFTLLDDWKAPEPSAYFDTRLKARLRQAAEEAPAGFWERLSAHWKFSSNYGMNKLRPAMAGALALVLLAGGGDAILRSGMMRSTPVTHSQSATVNDLRILDNNQQALEQMDQLLDDSNDDGGDSGPTT